ncbi:unnamed protein product [Kluyveromyces dobzhanskii CBS 2104]|uniref:WGS project CCBQ000000000 data, contig 00015 n=1 Tax=Kluyveromyces dobzhanskii CBS 2104 TaxID=1427455 RepID=A0A0A8LBI6_9SACH|nr:unnamed protein product [Kluyveromyces dobzhanskii CBS 2104]
MELSVGIENICRDFALYMQNEDFKSHLHYVSAISSFPISDMMELLPLQENETIYESINILSSVDLSELNKCVRSLYQRIIFNPVPKEPNTDADAHSQAGIKTEAEQAKKERHWICVEGLQTMFQCSQLRDPVDAHASLNDTMLRLRLLLTKCPSTNVLFLLPPQEAPAFVESLQEHEAQTSYPHHRRQGKRFKRDNTGVLIGDYVWKYYM